MRVQKTFQGRTAKQWLDIADTGPMQAGGWQINHNGFIFMKGADGMTINNSCGLLAVLELSDTQANRLNQLLEYCDAKSLEEAA